MKHAAIISSLLLALASMSTQAAEQVTIKVSGTITPGACQIEGGNANINLGAISVKSLKENDVTALDPFNTTGFSITCSSPSQFALIAKDGRGDTAYTNTVHGFGLGKTKKNENIGYWTLELKGAKSDGAAMRVITSANKTTWTTPAASAKFNQANGENFWIGFTSRTNGTAAPEALSGATFDLTIAPVLAPASKLSLDEAASIDGQATVELFML